MKKHTHRVGPADLVIQEGDITVLPTDAIVNAANESLLGGGGVDGAIHRAGGEAILAECRTLGGCRVGEAKATTAGHLPARLVIHTVGPRWRGGGEGEAERLAACHRASLALAATKGCSRVHFPAISTGVYGYPMADAARVALTTVLEALEAPSCPFTRVGFVLFGEEAWATWTGVLHGILDEGGTP